jgi:hypothetical protein
LNGGWTVEPVIGDEPLFRRLTDEFKVFSALDQMDAGQLEFDSWRARCEALGIADVPLSAAILTAAAC